MLKESVADEGNARPPPAVMMTLRLWQEVIDPQQREWRGEIKNLATGEVRYFRCWGEVAEDRRHPAANTGPR